MNFKSCIVAFILQLNLAPAMLYGLSSDFTVSMESPCVPALVVFQNESDRGPGIEFLWDFGKGAVISSDAEVLYETYSEAGEYTVTLKAIEGSDTVSRSQIIRLSDGPEAGISAEPATACLPGNIQFFDNSTPGDAAIVSWFWDFRNGDTETGNPVSYTYDEAGTYDIYLEVTDANGCSDYIESFDIVRILDLPKADFSASDSFACEAPLNVHFINLSSGYGALDYFWNFGNGQFSTNFEETVTYEEGSWDVSLTVSDQNGCTASLTKDALITVGSVSGTIYAAQSGTEFRNDGDILCPGTIDLHTTLPELQDIIWEIDYAGSVSSFEGMTVLSFPIPDSGRIDIMLRYNEGSGCGDTLSRSFLVEHIRAGFDMDPGFTCQLPLEAVMTNTSENASSHTWLFPDGSTDEQIHVSYTFGNDTSYRREYTHNLEDVFRPVILIVISENNCSDTLTKNMEITLPVARFMPDLTAGCIPLDVILSDSSRSSHPITTWTWLIEGEETVRSSSEPVAHTFSSPGDHEIVLIVENDRGCKDTSYSVSVQAGEKPEPWFSVNPLTLCPYDELQLHDLSPGQEQIDRWQYRSPDLFNTGSMDHPDTTVTIRPDGSGARDVYLTVESNGCSADTVIYDAFTLESPSGRFGEHVACDAPFDYTFIAFADGVDQISWKVDGMNVAGTDTMEYSFPETGDYLVEMILENSTTGCTLSRQKTITVRDVNADFQVKPIACRYENIELDASTSVDYLDRCYAEGFLWDFDDDTPPKKNYSPIQEHSFSDTGTYDISLVVTAANGCTDTSRFTIEVTEPVADFSLNPGSGCGPDLQVDFNFYSYTPTIDNWVWQFGDGAIDNAQIPDPVHTYHSGLSQTFTAVLSVQDVYGCRNQQAVPVTIVVPQVNFHAADNGICLGDAALFIIDSPGIDSYSWDYGDGTDPSGSSTHLYAEPGTYSVSLDIVDEGCEASVTRENYMSVEIADASFTVDNDVSTCYPATVNFDYTGNSSSIAGGIWTFQAGIQNPDFSPSVQYTYTEPGTYTASLSITTNNGCAASYGQIIEISGPDAEYSFAPAFMCSGDTVSFQIEAMDDVDDFMWVFGDGDTSHQQDPVHVYTARGELYPSLLLIQGSCEVTLSERPLYVSIIAADFEFQPENASLCANAPVYAQNHSQDYSSSVWKINGHTVSTSNHLSGEFDYAGINIVSLEVYNDLGCSDTLDEPVMVLPPPVFPITGDTSFCRGGEAFLQVPHLTDWTIRWEPAAWVTDPDRFETTVSPDTSAFITAIVTAANHCVGRDSILLHLKEPPAVHRVPVQDTSLFIGETLQLMVYIDDEAAEYSWAPDYRISCLDCHEPEITPHENTTYTCHVIAECLDDVLEFPVEVIIDFYLELPTAFSPNEDGINDIFRMEHHHVAEVDFRIFNRWGNLMFQTNDPDEGWDGTSAGKPQNPETYAYIIRASTIHGYEFERKGTFILLR